MGIGRTREAPKISFTDKKASSSSSSSTVPSSGIGSSSVDSVSALLNRLALNETAAVEDAVSPPATRSWQLTDLESSTPESGYVEVVEGVGEQEVNLSQTLGGVVLVD